MLFAQMGTTIRYRIICVVCILGCLSLPGVLSLRPSYRSFDGSGNSPTRPTLGAAGTFFYRLTTETRASLNSLPSARVISNKLAEVPKRLNDAQINLLQPFFAEIIAHDLVSTKRDGATRSISIPRCDAVYDPPRTSPDDCEGNRTIAFGIPTSEIASPYTYTNNRNSWLDLSWLYGLSASDNSALRVGVGGRIYVDKFFNNSGRIVLDQTAWILSGESPSVNLNPVFHSFFQIFGRNHNYWADFYRQQLPTASDEVVFQEARAMNIAEYQSIVSRQYLPVTIGEPLPPYSNAAGQIAYNASADPAIDLFFASSSFRYAHAEFRGYLPRLDADLNEIPQGGIALRTSFFNSLNHYVEDTDYGIYDMNVNGRTVRHGPAVVQLFRGLSHSLAGKVQPTLSDEMRNWVFSPNPAAPGLDLISLGIQMGREQRVGSYNDARRAFGLRPATTWREVTSDVRLQSALAGVYASVDDIDAWVGVLAEDTLPGAAVGPLARASLLDQFTRIRNADRFWYENSQFFSKEEIDEIHGVNLRTLLRRNFPKMMTKTVRGEEAVAGDQFAPGPFFLPNRQLTNYGSTSNGLFYPDPPVSVERTMDLSPVFRLSWRVNPENQTITYVFQGRFSGWMGLGVGADKNSMKGADIVLCRFIPNSNGSLSNAHECRDSFALDVGIPVLDTDVGGRNDIQYSYARINGEFQTFMFVKAMSTGDRFDKPIFNNTEQGVIFAFNPTTHDLRYHGPTRSPDYRIKFVEDKTLLLRSEPVPAGVSALIGVVTAVGCAIGVFTFIVVTMKQDYFRYQETVFCQMILFGTIVGYVSSFVNIAPWASAATCITNLWFLHLSYVFVVGCLFVKTWRMWRLLDLSSLQVLKITRMDMLRLIAIYLVLESAVLLAWTLVDPPMPRAIVTDVTGQVTTLGCQQQNDAWWFVTMALKLVFLAFGTFLSIKNRNHAPIFNDSKTVGISTYVLFITMLIVGIIGIALRQYVVAVLIVKSLGIVIPYAVITIVLFGGTIVKVISGKPAATSLTYVKSSKNSFQSNTLSHASMSEASESRRTEGKGAAPAPVPAPSKTADRSARKSQEPNSQAEPTRRSDTKAAKKPRSPTTDDEAPKAHREKKPKRNRDSGPRQATSAKSSARRTKDRDEESSSSSSE